jgi:hypothetical protein
MSKFNGFNLKIFVTSLVIGFLIIILSSTSVQIEIFAALPGEKALFDCTYDNDKKKEICCDSLSNALKCMECNVDLQTEQKYNCREIPPKSNDVQPADLVEAPRNLDKPIQNFSESEAES